MEIALWILQWIIVLAFVAAAGRKLLQQPPKQPATQIIRPRTARRHYRAFDS